jgi:hypothetical protein
VLLAYKDQLERMALPVQQVLLAPELPEQQVLLVLLELAEPLVPQVQELQAQLVLLVQAYLVQRELPEQLVQV